MLMTLPITLFDGPLVGCLVQETLKQFLASTRRQSTSSLYDLIDVLGRCAMRGHRFSRQPQPFMSPYGVGTGPIIGLVIIVAMVLLLAALGGH
jgi:hypothetical protein